MRFPKSILLVAVILIAAVSAQNLTAINNYIKKPQAVSNGIIYTDDNFSAIYHLINGSSRELVRARNVGQYYTIAPDKLSLGIKLIDSNGQQTPAIVDLQTGEISRLSASAKQIGQVSFTSDGRNAYTIGTSLKISDGRTVNLGYYANIAPISPDGEFVCFNDANDQIWLMNIDTQSKTQISDAQDGYYQPKWSPDGGKIIYSAFTGAVKIYEIATQMTYSIESADDPNWNDDSETIIFSRKEIENHELINSDVYLAKYNGESVTNITNTPNVIEMDATFGISEKEILYRVPGKKDITLIRLNNSKSTLDKNKTEAINLNDVKNEYYPEISTITISKLINVPYLHQVYDVPNWYWGYYACAPTTAAMLLAYYNILPVWNVTCSSPSSHTSKWGRYICERYFYNEVDYNWSSSPAGHTAGKGGYGYMWGTGGSPNSRMANYYEFHGLTANQIWPSNTSTTWTVATTEINNGYPYTMCVWLTSSGHLILARGIVDGQHSLVFNDPYGNRNGSSYPAYNGNGVIYDWPGYNEGNANLAYAGTGIPWCISAHYTVPSVSDSLIDDLNLAQGFTLNTDAPSSMTYWKDMKTGGYNGHFWYTSSRMDDTCSAEWKIPLVENSKYLILAYIPKINNLSSNVTYTISTGINDSSVVINQHNNQGRWVSLGVHNYDANENCTILLTDSTGKYGEYVAFDAVQIVKSPSISMNMNSYTGDWYREGPPKTIFFQGQTSYYPDYAKCLWDFGDGSTADSLNPEHVYRSEGNFKVTFMVIYGGEAFSIDTTISIEPAAAVDFSLLVPENESVLTNAEPLFYWLPKLSKNNKEDSEISSLLDGYENFSLYLHHNTAFNEVEPIILDTNLYRPSEPLTENTEYFWTVVAEDTAGNKTLSPIWSFIINTENSAPSLFALISPGEKEVVTELTPEFYWNMAQDIDPNEEIIYQLRIGTGLDELQVVYEGNDTTCTLSDPLTDNKIYFWQVVAIDGAGVATVNDHGFGEFCVNLANDSPTAVTLLTPQNNSHITTQYPMFLWSAARDVDPYETLKYILYYWRSDFNYIYQYPTDTTFCDRRKALSNREYHWYVATIDAAGDIAVSDTFCFTTGNVGIDKDAVPLEFALHQNYPNPFNPITNIAVDLPEETGVTLTVYDLMGREITTLLNGRQPAGSLNVIWNGKDKSGQTVASGIYLYILKTTSGRTAIKKMALVR